MIPTPPLLFSTSPQPLNIPLPIPRLSRYHSASSNPRGLLPLFPHPGSSPPVCSIFFLPPKASSSPSLCQTPSRASHLKIILNHNLNRGLYHSQRIICVGGERGVWKMYNFHSFSSSVMRVICIKKKILNTFLSTARLELLYKCKPWQNP